ncbi:DUF192 domain-containing protein [Aquimonas voraii]|uniref:DUF192 domain-containing protein n=1 Tax=Aquimonas voraii TaxID=265719 RepID=A0A1G6WTY8_9GAMM|nr:DUF192 domain-containing protein [Aquimonas voraii]SDD69400.1 hypothetical protein SAMN04488509_105168 [Aquimonas voraii]
MSVFRYRNGSVHCARRGLLLARAAQPQGFAARARGLLGRSRLDPQEALWFDRCSAVHMFGMRMSIDLVFLRAGEVIRLCEDLRPYRFRACAGADASLELAAHQIQALGLRLGDQLEFREHENLQ